MEQEEHTAIVNWVNTFSNLPKSCVHLSDLCDGHIIAHMLLEIAPAHFASSSLTDDGGNLFLRASNLRTVLSSLEDYYRIVLRKRVDISLINVNEIAKCGDADEIVAMVELVLGAAMVCDNKAAFIEKIFGLDNVTQNVLKDLIQQGLGRAVPDDEGTTTRQRNSSDAAEELIRAQELARHLQEERDGLLNTVSELEGKCSLLERDVDMLKEKLALKEDEQQERNRNTMSISVANSLQMELDDAKREHDLVTVENEKLKADFRKLQMSVNSLKEAAAKAEQEKFQMVDELDVAKAKASQLSKLEATLEKYKGRLEELNDLKKQNKELTEKLDEYIDTIHHLESSNKAISTNKELAEQYKNKLIESERKEFEAVSRAELLSHEVERLNSELEGALEARRFLDDEMSSMKSKLDQYEISGRFSMGPGAASGGSQAAAADGGGAFEVESVPVLREKIKTLTRQLEEAQAAVASGGNLSSNSGSHMGGGGAGPSPSEELLRAELEDALRIKNEREESLLSSKRTLQETQQELQKMTKALLEADQKNGLHAGTIKMLEDKLKEKESAFNTLEQQKTKLEIYAKSSLKAFRDKYMNALQQIKSDKKALEEKLALMTSKHEKNLETSRREERLLLSAMYELGVKIMDRDIQKRSTPLADL